MSEAQIRKLWAELKKVHRRLEVVEQAIKNGATVSPQGDREYAAYVTYASVSKHWRPYLRKSTQNAILNMAQRHNIHPNELVNRILDSAIKKAL